MLFENIFEFFSLFAAFFPGLAAAAAIFAAARVRREKTGRATGESSPS